MTQDNRFDAAMRRALELALRGPARGVNPQVGAVILDRNLNIISEGWHEGSGTPHAEVMALSQLAMMPDGATAVVTLEPCNHTGKTGPCSQALIAAGVSRVVYASSDIGITSGGGAETLRAAGIEVISGVLKAEADFQARVWLTAAKQQRPFVTLKWATTIDGRTAAADGTSQWISGLESRADVHLRRSQLDAILVGTGTAITDNPTLTARRPDGSLYPTQPLRVVLGDRSLPPTLNLFNNEALSLHLRTRDLNQALRHLWELGIKHVWVEGGPGVASQFVKHGLVNEYLIYQAPMLLGGPNASMQDIGVATMSQAIKLQILHTQKLGEDLLIVAAPARESTASAASPLPLEVN